MLNGSTFAMADMPEAGTSTVNDVGNFNTFLVCGKTVLYGADWKRAVEDQKVPGTRRTRVALVYKDFQLINTKTLPTYLTQDKLLAGYMKAQNGTVSDPYYFANPLK